MSPKAPSHDDRLRELAQALPWARPDAERREAVRSSLLVAAAEDDRGGARPRWRLVGGGFAAGALAAAAIALVVARSPEPAPPRAAVARIDAPASALLEHTVTPTATGTDELVRVRGGTVRLAVPQIRAGDRVRLATADAIVEGNGAYEVAVAADHLERVTVTAGTARLVVRVGGATRQVFLASGQTWRATIHTAELALPHPPEPAPEPTTEPTSSAPAPSTVTSRASDAARTEAASTWAPPAPSTRSTSAAGSAEPTTAAASVGGDRTRPAVVARTPSTSPAAATTAEGGGGDSPSTAATASTSASVEPGGDRSRLPAVTALETSPAPARAPRQASPTERHFQAGWALLREGKARAAAVELGRSADAGGDDPLAADARYFQAVALVRAGQRRDAERVLVAFLDRAPRSLRRGRAAVLLGTLRRDRGDVASARAWFTSALSDADPAIAGAARAHLEALAASPGAAR